MARFIPSEIHREARVTVLAHPSAFRNPRFPTTDELNDVYDPDTNQNGLVFWVMCAWMNNAVFTNDVQTNNDLRFCDKSQVETAIGFNYGFTVSSRLDSDFRRFSSNNLFRQLTTAPDRNFILIDRVREDGGSTSDFEVGDWIRCYEIATDLPNYNVSNAAPPTIEFSPISAGSVWDLDLVL